MNRREFLLGGAAMGVAAAALAEDKPQGGCKPPMGCPHLIPPAQPAKLNLCLQLWGIPVDGEYAAKLDYLEANGYACVEVPSGDWLFREAGKFMKAMEGRKLKLTTACGPSDLSSADAAAREKEVQRLLPMLDVLGQMGSTGLIICPARRHPGLPFEELRKSFVEDTGKRLAERAAKAGTSIVLEPLCRGETPFLKQVADGASMARDIGAGATVMGDFWHMSKEETSFMGAFISAGKLLSHVHIASLRTRRIPGTDGEADNYVDGFRGLKLLGYQGAVSFECGFPPVGKNAQGKDIAPNNAEKQEILKKACAMLREQWEQA